MESPPHSPHGSAAQRLRPLARQPRRLPPDQKARSPGPSQNQQRAQLPSRPPRAQVVANRRRTRPPPAPGIHPANPAASLENENYKTNPSVGPGRPSKRRRNRMVVRS